ncbi:hypothetical protein KJ966_30055 [bacterium]|nr:hypothetical protein [bacterium]
MADSAPVFISPEALDVRLQEESDIDNKVLQVSEALISLSSSIGNREDASNIRNVIQTLINQEELFKRLFVIYEEIYTIWQRLRALITRSSFEEEERLAIQQRAADIISENVFQMQREVFFKIVNAKEVSEGEKNEDGPALLFPGVEKTKNAIIRSIQYQAEQLKPVAMDICKTFRGIADAYVETEQVKPGERASYDTIAQSYEREKKIREEVSGEINLSRIDDISYLESLIESFQVLKKTYALKIKSLQDKLPEKVVNFEEKIRILKEGGEKVDLRLKPLKVLKNLVKRFPNLEKQLDFFAESQYQAKAVMRFLEEVNDEMGKIFKQYSLESFTVVSFLRYKLNGTSHMYESIYYYYAVVQIEADIRGALAKRYAGEGEDKRLEIVAADMKKTGIEAMVLELHRQVAQMNEANYWIHEAFLEYKASTNLEKLRQTLGEQTGRIDSFYKAIKAIYKEAQKVFLSFLSEDLGATDLSSQFNTFLKINRDIPEAELIRKAFPKLLTTKRKDFDELERKLEEQFGKKMDPQKLTALAQLKVKQDFQKELLFEIQEHPRAQDIFLHILKQFIKIQDEQSPDADTDNSVIWLVQKDFPNEITEFKTHEARLFKKILQTPNLSERDIAVCFLGANITPQEIESFSRLLPALPRNELQLDSPYGRILLDIKTMHKERLQLRGGSVAHLTEKIYEKRERFKLVSNICLFFRACADPFYKRIESEEHKTNHLILLQSRKFQKELNEVIKYWQYLVQEQISPGQGERGRFRVYKPEEVDLMSKYISPEQLSVIERQLESNYDLEGESRLFEVESFLMEVVDGLFKNFKEDLRIKAKFENYEKEKKIRHRQFQNEEYKNILESDSFVPRTKESIKRVKKVSRRKTIGQFIDYWEYQIEQKVPSSERRKKKQVPKVDFKSDSDNAVHYISPKQLTQIHEDLDLIQTIRDAETQKSLVLLGLPVIKMARQCAQLFKEGQQKLVMKEISKERKERMTHCFKDPEFETAIETLLSLVE